MVDASSSVSASAPTRPSRAQRAEITPARSMRRWTSRATSRGKTRSFGPSTRYTVVRLMPISRAMSCGDVRDQP